MTTLFTAICFIRYDRMKSIGIIIGIIICTFLIGQQLGIFNFLTNLMASLVYNSNAQIWVTDNRTVNANQLGKIDLRYVSEIKSIPDVSQASPLVIGNGVAVIPNGTSANVLLIGSEAPLFLIGPNISKITNGTVDDLLADGAMSVDYFDDEVFGQVMQTGTRFEINGKEAHVVLRSKNLRGFGSSQLFTTIDKVRFYSNLSPTSIHAILVNVTPGVSVSQVIQNINNRFPLLHAWTKKQLARSTIHEILSSSGIAASTITLIGFALITGILIIGLTMYSSVLDRIRDYGTMKAIGANFRYLIHLLFYQAMLFSFIGFICAWILLEIFRIVVANTGLIVNYQWYEIMGIFLITSIISTGGMFFALFRIKGVEPASVFRA